MEKILLELMFITCVIHLIDTLAYSVRLNSVRSGQFALSMSLFNVFVLVSRTANMLQGPLIGVLIGSSIAGGSDPIGIMRNVIFASTLGTIIGIVFIPTFLRIFSVAVSRLESTGSVPSLVIAALSLDNLRRIRAKAAVPRKQMLYNVRFREIPKRLLLFNTLITGIYTIGVLAAFYAATLVPADKQLAVVASSGIINGVASILLTMFVDPKAAVITDQALRGDRPDSDVKALVVLLIGTKLLGTILAQALLIPAAYIIASFYR